MHKLSSTITKKENKKNSKLSTNLQPSNKSFPKLLFTPFNLFLEFKITTEKNKSNFEMKAFKKKCKKEWDNMSNTKQLFWLNFACEKIFEYRENNNKILIAKSTITLNSFQKKLILAKSIIDKKCEKVPSCEKVMLSKQKVKKNQPNENNIYISHQCKKYKPGKRKEYHNNLKVLPQNVKPGLVKKSIGKTKLIQEKEKEIKMIHELNNILINKPEMPPANAFYLFIKDYEDLYLFSDDAMHVWKKLPFESKQLYKKLLLDIQEQYIIDYKYFLEHSVDDINQFIEEVVNCKKTDLNKLAGESNII